MMQPCPPERAWRFACVLGLALASAWIPTRAAAQCEHLNFSVTEHSCFHARLGPFDEVSAAYEGGPAKAPDVNQVHTHYRVALPAKDGVKATSARVEYTPARSGLWAVYMEYPIPLELQDASGAVVPVVHEDSVPDCPFFEHVQGHMLEANETYQLVFTLTDATSSVVVIEKTDDFLEAQGRDEDGDGYGAEQDAMTSACLPPEGYVANDSDCDDSDPSIHPGATELCDEIDRNCNGSPDDVGAPCMAGLGECAAPGIASCEVDGEPPTCDAEALDPGIEQCNGIDDDCDGTVDDGLDVLCGSQEAPRCVSDGTGLRFCGCEDDRDCGGPNSGRVCLRDKTEQRCVDGCVDGFDRNGCLPGLHCTSSDPTVVGECTEPPPQEPSDAGLDEVDAGGEPDTGTDEPVDDGGGCRCQTTKGPLSARGVGGYLCVLLPVLAYFTRRRRSVTRGRS